MTFVIHRKKPKMNRDFLQNREDRHKRYNKGMRNFVDEIVLAILCCLVSLLASKSDLAIVGVLAAVVLISICAYANKPVRISAQVLFYLCATMIGDVFFYLPVVVYLALRERSWLVRLIWIAPLVGVMALNASGVTGSYGIGLQVRGSLIAEGLTAAGIAGAFEVVMSIEVLLCAIAVVLAVRNLRETSERESYRFAYDDLREGYLSLMQAAGQNTEEDNETARLIAHEAERFADLTERELSVVRLVAQGMDNREIASTLFLSEGTVRNHISSILSKKAFSNRTQIAVLYYRG